MDISADTVSTLFPAAQDPQALHDAIWAIQQASYGIDTPERMAMLLAQAAHESQGLSRFEENLNYSAGALRRVFPHYFPDDDTAAAYAHQPERIANRVYGNRMGNGDEASGDGWKHRGAGAFQLTGKDNHRAFSIAQFGDERLVDDPGPLRTLPLAIVSAAWFWDQHGLNHYADDGDFDSASDIINIGHRTAAQGDAIGYQDRVNWWQRVKAALGVA
jgi:putative chitinase